jgi:hypothetical protein
MDSFLKEASSRRPEDCIRMDLIRANTLDAEKAEKTEKKSNIPKDEPTTVKIT